MADPLRRMFSAPSLMRWCRMDSGNTQQPPSADPPPQPQPQPQLQRVDPPMPVSLSPAPPPIVVFTDGSCFGNGKRSATGAYAVLFPAYHPLHTEALPVHASPRHGPPTNNRAELMGCIRALEIARDAIDPTFQRPLVIYTDSQLLIDSVTKWLPGWKRRGWKKADGKSPVLNRDLLERIDHLRTQRGAHTCAFRFVRAHTGKDDWESKMNAQVDQLARAAAAAAGSFT